MGSINVSHACIGGSSFGQGAFAREYDVTITYADASASARTRTQYGFGAFGSRVFSRPYEWTPLSSSSGVSGTDISLTTFNGSFLGRIRTDIQNSIVESLVFINDQNGCNTFDLVLSALPDFPIVPLCMVQVKVNGSAEGFYKGIIEYAPEFGSSRENGYRFRGFGLRKTLDRVRAERIFSAPMDVGQIVATIVQENIVPETPIQYNPSKIDVSTGVLIASNNDISKHPIKKVLDMYATMSGYQWGVDGEGDFYFEQRTTATRDAIFVGYDVQDFDPELNIDAIKNSIFVKRQNGMGSGGAGWAVAAIANDTRSQSKYGVRELQYQMSGFFSDDDCELVADRLLEEMKEPKYSAEISGFILGDRNTPIDRGYYNLVAAFSTFEASINDCDDSTEFTKFGSGDLALSTETSIIMSGAASLKMQYTSAVGDRAQCDVSVNAFIERLQFYVRSQNDGIVGTVGFGVSVWNENTRSISIPLDDTWLLFDWDVSGLSITEIGKFAIQISDASPGIIYIDRIVAVAKGNRHYPMELSEVEYSFKPDKRGLMDMKFTPTREKMYDYVSELMAQSQENKIVGENR